MKNYFKIIKYLQELLLGIAILTMMALPIVLVFYSQLISDSVNLKLYAISHIFLFFVMMIRPLSDIFTKTKWLRPLVILRKGAGVMSAAIVISFILAKLMVDPANYLGNMMTFKYWSMVDFAVLAHMADLSAIILIITSNNLSKKLLGTWWKKIQKLSYVYFYGSVLYVYLSFGNPDLLIALILVTAVTCVAFIKNKKRERLIPQTI